MNGVANCLFSGLTAISLITVLSPRPFVTTVHFLFKFFLSIFVLSNISDSSTKLHRLQPISSKEATEDGDPDSESGNDEEKSEDEFELELIQPVDKGRGKSRQQNSEGTKKNKKRKSESKAEEVHGTEKKSKKSKKTRNTNMKKRANENSDVDSCAINEDALLKKKKKKKGKQTKKKKLVSKSTGKTINDEVEIVNSNDTAHKQETEDSTWAIGLADVNGNRKNSNTDKEHSGTETKDVCVDPKKIFRIEDQGDVAGKGESDSLRQKRIDIQQAFANDDVVEEFMKEKNAIEEASKPNDIDLSLPGWGSWAGAGIKPSTRKKQLFTKKANPPPPRKDKDMSHVIINEEKSKFFARNQVWREASCGLGAGI